MSIGILVLTNKALESAIYLRQTLLDKDCKDSAGNNDRTITIFAPMKLKKTDKDQSFISYYEEQFSHLVGSAYNSKKNLIFIMAMGIVVRTIAPLIKDKTLDPAVVVMDENLQFAISLIGGHVAGANELARRIGDNTSAVPVITTATDVAGKGALDIIARDLSAYQQSQRTLYKTVNYALAQGKQIFLILDEYTKNEKLDTRGFTVFDYKSFEKNKSLIEEEINRRSSAGDNEPIIVLFVGVTSPSLDSIHSMDQHIMVKKLIPKKICLGMGCKKNTPPSTVKKVFFDFMELYQLDHQSIAEISSIELKSKEQGLIQLAEDLGVKYHIYNNDAIIRSCKEKAMTSSSDFVKTITGVPAVAEPCAYLSSNGNVITSRYADQGVTIAAGYRIYDKTKL